MTRVKLGCITGCPGLKSRYREEGLLQNNHQSNMLFLCITKKF